MDRCMVLRMQGSFELTALILFFTGYFGGSTWLMLLGGIMLVVDNVMTIALGLTSPLLPLGLSTLLALIVQPWYAGAFLGCAVFTLLGVPNSVRKIWDPEKVLETAERVDSSSQASGMTKKH
jgi:hypothetical protein